MACIEAADAMCKAANVELIGYEKRWFRSRDCDGERRRRAVKAAGRFRCGISATGGEVVTSLVIARPHNDINKIVIKHKA